MTARSVNLTYGANSNILNGLVWDGKTNTVYNASFVSLSCMHIVYNSK